jgi:hypothetical protein
LGFTRERYPKSAVPECFLGYSIAMILILMYSYYLNLGFVILCYRYGVLTLTRGLILAADIFNGKQLCATGYKSFKKLISETYGSYYVFKSVFLITITEMSMANF